MVWENSGNLQGTKGIIRFMRYGMPQRSVAKWLALAVLSLGLAVMCACQNTYVFEKKIAITAMPEKVFAVVSDFESYPVMFPEFHKRVNIVSKIKTGKGVLFENVSEFKGVVTRSTWEVAEFEKNKLIRLENPMIGTILILMNQIDYNTTEETLIVVTRLPDNYKSDVFAEYEKELLAVKERSER
jgi:hypothetical protein